MPVRMVALRRCYVTSLHKEFESGDSFSAADDREAERLTRQKRAMRAAEPKAAPAPKRKMLTLNEPSSDQKMADGSIEPNYRRRDMRAED